MRALVDLDLIGTVLTLKFPYQNPPLPAPGSTPGENPVWLPQFRAAQHG
ncbi:hypothetical protein [Streptomyces sp. NPDC020917]